jgi:hypothetical protein
VRFILGYIAAGSEFQWLYIDKSGKISPAGGRLNLSTDFGCCHFLLSIGYAYQLISKMAATVPEVPGRRAMFTGEEVGDGVIYFHSTFVRKSIKNFETYCWKRMTGLDEILKAYDARERKGCKSLPRLRWSNLTDTGLEARLIDRKKKTGC